MVRDLRNLGRQTAFFAGRGKRKDAVAVKRIARRCKVSGTVWRCLRGQPASERGPACGVVAGDERECKNVGLLAFAASAHPV